MECEVFWACHNYHSKDILTHHAVNKKTPLEKTPVLTHEFCVSFSHPVRLGLS
jgi:hypothetical protein